MKKLILGETDLGTTHPNLCKEWDYARNSPLTPQDVTSNSNKKVHWKCKKGHEWQTAIWGRAKSSARCPYCTNQKILEGYNDLASQRPDIAKEWHSTKNGDLLPTQVPCGTNKKVWWLCKEGHEWDARVSSRTSRNDGCPYCGRKKLLTGCNDLATLYPEIAKKWHPTKNVALTPNDVTCKCHKKVWWLGDCGHEWEAVVHSLTEGRDCPYCGMGKLQVGVNDLLSQRPDIARQWDYEKNYPLKPDEVTVGNPLKVWWMCDICGYAWKVDTHGRTARKWNYCPRCVRGRQTSYAEQFVYFCMKELFPNAESRAKLDGAEADVYIPELKLVIEYDGWHHTRIKTQEREKIKDLHFKELGVRVLRLKENPITYENTDINLKIIDVIKHKNSILGLTVVIEDILAWINLTYNLSLTAIIPLNIEQKVIEELAILDTENSLAVKYPKIAAELDPIKNENIRADSISFGSNFKLWWKCTICNHSWNVSAANRTKGRGCPVCGGHTIKEGYNDLATTAPHLLIDWAYDLNELKPTEVSKGSSKKVYWRCHRCGEVWEKSILHEHNRKTRGCAKCKVNI